MGTLERIVTDVKIEHIFSLINSVATLISYQYSKWHNNKSTSSSRIFPWCQRKI